MSHILIVGTSGSGKTTFARSLVDTSIEKGRPAIIFDPIGPARGGQGPDWHDDAIVFDDIETFSQYLLNAHGVLAVIDEAGEYIGKSSPHLYWLATRARHKNIQSVFITHRPTQLAPVVRDNCGTLVLFAAPAGTGAMLAEEFNNESLRICVELKVGERLIARRMGGPTPSCGWQAT